jgi:hypothetical protein
VLSQALLVKILIMPIRLSNKEYHVKSKVKTVVHIRQRKRQRKRQRERQRINQRKMLNSNKCDLD